MKSVEFNSDLFLSEVLKSFFPQKEITTFLKLFPNGEAKNNASPSIINKQQLELKIDDGAFFREKLDAIINRAEKSLDRSKYLEMLLHCGIAASSRGEFSSARYLFKNLIKLTEKDPDFASFIPNSYLAIAEISSRQAEWKITTRNAKKSLSLFNKFNDLKGAARCENLLGTIYGEQGKLKEADKHFQNALIYLTDDKALTGMVEINLGILFNINGELDQAFTYYNRALSNFERIKNYRRISEARHNMGMAYIKKNDYENAVKQFNESISAAIQSNFLPSLGFAFLSKAFTYVKTGDFALAEAFANKALKIFHKLNDRLSMADTYKVKGIVYRNLNNFKLSENYLLTSLRINKELLNKLNTAETNYELGLLYKEVNKLNESEYHFITALKYFKQIEASSEVEEINLHLPIKAN